MATTIAVVNTDQAFLEFAGMVLRESGYAPHLFTVHEATFPQVRALVPAAIVLDIPPHENEANWQLFTLFVQEAALSQTPVLLCIPDTPEAEQRAEPLSREHDVWVRKPFDIQDVLDVLQRVTRDRS
jgi:DNA-binding response OmpR family regulator